MNKKLDVSPYKGVRDFYPEEMQVQKWLFSAMRETAEKFGYTEYGASVLESSELYKEKSGEEIVGEQMYTFLDRGDREVALRPEMTPTVARMVAARKRDLAVPIRWYSIPNLFRYERPQRGRLREHWQLNVDIFGIEGIEAEAEIISVAHNLLTRLGAKESDFEIRINSRNILTSLFGKLGIPEEHWDKITKLLDKIDKVEHEIFAGSIKELIGDKTESLLAAIESGRKTSETLGEEDENMVQIIKLINLLDTAGIKNIVFTPTLARGFDYYTGIVFEIFDTHPENRRSIFGGGRYDDLLALFGGEKLPAVGFGMGDVTLSDFLEVRNLLPTYRPETDIYICRVDDTTNAFIGSLANKLRESGVNVAVDYTNRKVGDQIKAADKMKIPYVIAIGEEEKQSGRYKLKNLSTSEEKELSLEDIPGAVK